MFFWTWEVNLEGSVTKCYCVPLCGLRVSSFNLSVLKSAPYGCPVAEI